jgi:hypothetical protein
MKCSAVRKNKTSAFDRIVLMNVTNTALAENFEYSHHPLCFTYLVGAHAGFFDFRGHLLLGRLVGHAVGDGILVFLQFGFLVGVFSVGAMGLGGDVFDTGIIRFGAISVGVGAGVISIFTGVGCGGISISTGFGTGGIATGVGCGGIATGVGCGGISISTGFGTGGIATGVGFGGIVSGVGSGVFDIGIIRFGAISVGVGAGVITISTGFGTGGIATGVGCGGISISTGFGTGGIATGVGCGGISISTGFGTGGIATGVGCGGIVSGVGSGVFDIGTIRFGAISVGVGSGVISIGNATGLGGGGNAETTCEGLPVGLRDGFAVGTLKEIVQLIVRATPFIRIKK